MNQPPTIAWDGGTNAPALGGWNGEIACWEDLPTSTTVPLVMSDDTTDPAALTVVLEYQFGGPSGGDWWNSPTFEDMSNLGGGRYTHTFGPYLTEIDFLVRFTVRATDADGATAQLPERTILVRTCPPPPPQNQPPTIEWVDSGHLTWIDSRVDGFECTPGVPKTGTVTARVADDTTPADQLEVYIMYVFGDETGWLADTYGYARMAGDGGGGFNHTFGPYAYGRPHLVWYYVTAMDAQQASASTDDIQTIMGIHGCVILY